MIAPTPLDQIPCEADGCEDGRVEVLCGYQSPVAIDPAYDLLPCEDCGDHLVPGFLDFAECGLCGNEVSPPFPARLNRPATPGTAYEFVQQPPAGVTFTMILCRACIAEALNVCAYCWQPEVGGWPARADAERGLPTCAACRAKGEEVTA